MLIARILSPSYWNFDDRVFGDFAVVDLARSSESGGGTLTGWPPGIKSDDNE